MTGTYILTEAQWRLLRRCAENDGVWVGGRDARPARALLEGGYVRTELRTLYSHGRKIVPTAKGLELLAELITTPAKRFHCDYCSRFVRDDEARQENGTAYHKRCGVGMELRSVPSGSKHSPQEDD